MFSISSRIISIFRHTCGGLCDFKSFVFRMHFYLFTDMVRIIVMKNKLALSIALLALTLVFGCRFIDFPHARLRLFHNFLTIKHTLVSDHRRPNLSAAFRAVEDALASRAINVLEMTPDALTIVKRERERFPMKMLIPFPRGCQFMRKLIDYEGQTVEIYWLDYRYTSNNWNSNHILLYLHGGGYILGDFQGIFLLSTHHLRHASSRL